MKPNITIKIGAAHDSVDVDGTVFDRSHMKGPEKRKLTRLMVGALTNAGYFEVSRA